VEYEKEGGNFCLLSFVFCLLSFVFCLLSFVFCLLFVFCLSFLLFVLPKYSLHSRHTEDKVYSKDTNQEENNKNSVNYIMKSEMHLW